MIFLSVLNNDDGFDVYYGTSYSFEALYGCDDLNTSIMVY